jgi:rubredoxin/NAD(P)H-flavin reductase
MNKIWSVLWYLIILWLLFIISIVNIESLVYIDFSNIYVVLFLAYFLLAIFFNILWNIMKINSEFKYITHFILLFCILILPWIFINHHFLLEHLWENNLYLRVYWKVAMFYFALALIISPILEFIKNWKYRKKLILSRKILWILAFIFFLKHWLEYFGIEYIFQNKYHWETPYLTYVLDNLLIRYDALSWVVAWILMLVLGLTSNKFSVKFLWKKWKKVQSLVFPAFLISAIHVAFASKFDEFYIFLISLVVILRLVAYLNRKQKRSSWKIVWYRCVPCWYIYDEKIWDLDSWIAPWTKFEDIPDDWYCPVCWVTKDDFEAIYAWDKILEKSEIIWYKMLTDNVLELKIKVLNLEDIEVKSWQFANIWFWEFSRSYSIVNIEKNILTFWIKLKKWWRWWKILKKLNIWDNLIFEWIFWNFVLQNTKNPKVFIVTWTWLSPIINMINNSQKSKNKLFFWVAKEKDLFYLNKLEKISNLKTEIFLSREEKKWYNFWRIDLSKYNFEKNTEFYICWNSWLVKSNREYLEKSWFKNVYSEEF